MSKNRRKKPKTYSSSMNEAGDFSARIVAMPKPEIQEEFPEETEAEIPLDVSPHEPVYERNSTVNEPPEPEREIRVVVSEPKQEQEQQPKVFPKPNKAKLKSERIGDILRTARTDRGEDLYLIAEYLCIKPSFLIALENSRYDEFPADAYVIGFLRTYANFLGIDGKAAIDRYRYEMAGRRKKPILSMPTPVSEGRTPSGIVMVGAAVALLLIYALWYSFSSPDRAEVHVAPPLPTALQAVPNVVDPSAAGLTAPLSSTTSPETSAATTSAASPSITVPAASAPPPPPAASDKTDSEKTSATAPIPATSATPSTSSTPIPAQSATPVLSSTAVVIPPASPGIVLSSDKPPLQTFKDDIDGKTANKALTEVKDTNAKNSEKETKAEIKSDASDKKTEAPATDPADNSRVSIRATQNTWVMVIDNSGKTLFDRVLKPGESFKVPNQKGLSLTTGNGTGIVLSLDGKDLPKLSTGTPHVVRNVPLDPARLPAEMSQPH